MLNADNATITGGEISANDANITAQKDFAFSGDKLTVANELQLNANNATISGGEISARNAIVNAENFSQNGGNIEAKAAAVNVGNNMQLNGGLLRADIVRLSSEQGNITQQYDNSVTQANGGLVYAGDLYISANKTASAEPSTVDLGSRFNHLNNVIVEDGTTANITVGNGNDVAGILTVRVGAGDAEAAGQLNGSLTVHNYVSGAANKLIVNDNLLATGNITLVNDEANVEIGSNGSATNLAAANIYLQSNYDVIHNGGTITVTEKAFLDADGNILLQSGTMDAKNLDLLALGYIDESYNNSDANPNGYTLKVSDTLETLAGGSAADTYGVDLGSKFNQLHNVILDSDNGNITLGNGSTSDTALNVSVQSGQVVNGNILITNYEAGVANDINIYSALRATGNIKVTNEERDVNVVSGASVDATKVELYAYGDVKNNANIHSTEQVYLVASNDIRNEASITSGKDLILWSMNGDIENEGTIEAAEKIDMDATLGNVYNFAGITSTNAAVDILAGKNIINLGDNANDAITAKGAVKLDAGVALINTAKIVSIEDNVTIQADSGVMNLAFTDYKGEGSTNQNGSIEAKGNVVIATTNQEAPDTSAKVYNSADIKAEGNVDIDAYGSLYNSGNITAVNEVHLDSWKSDLHNTGDIVSEQGDVRLYANQNLYNGTEEDKDGNVTAKNQIELIAYKGNLINYGNMESRTSSVALTGGDIYETELNNNRDVVSDITNYGSITAAEAVLVRTVNGSINNHKQITSQNSTVTIKTEQHQDYIGQTAVGDINNGVGETFDQHADITAAKGITLQAAGDILNTGDYLVTGEGDITLAAGRDVENIGNYTLNKSGKISVAADRDLLNEGNFFTPQGDITMTSGEDVLNMGVMEAVDGTINIISKDGVIYNEVGADLLSGNGDVNLKAESEDGYYYYFDNGELVQITEADVKTKTTGELYYENEAGNKFAVVKNGSVFNAGDILALHGTITLEAVKGNLTNYDDFNSLMDVAGNKTETYKASNAQGLDGTGVDIATGNIVFKAEHGSLYNDKVLESGESISLTAAKGLTNFAYNVYAGKDITLTATTGDVVNSATLESYAGNVTLHAENGNVINGVQNDITVGKGDIITYGGNVTLLAEGYDVAGNAGSVTNYGDIIATNTNAADKLLTGSIILESQHGNVDNFDDFNTYNVDGVYYKDYVADNHGSIASINNSYNIANNNLTISAKEGKIYNSKDYLVALGDVTLEAKTGLSSFGTAIYAGKNITLSATEGDLFNKAELLSVEGDIKLQAEKGTVVNLIGGDMIARNGNVILKAGADASNTVKVVDAIGNVTELSGAQAEAAGDSILITKQYYKDSSGAWIELAKTNEGEVVAPSTASEFKTEVFYLEGDNRNNQQLITEIVGDKNSGLVEAYRTGDVVNRGDIVAQGTAADKGAVTLHSLHGNTTNYDNFKLLNGKNTYDYLGANQSAVDDEINTIIARFNPNTVYFYDAKGILISDSDMNLLADQGSLYNNMNIISEKDVNLTSGKDLSIGNSVASVIAKGNVIVKSTAGHVINDSHVESQEGSIVLDGEQGVTSQVGAANLSAVNGSISVVTTYGEINVDELMAGEMAAAGTKDAGSINIGKVEGKDVVLYTENAATTIKISGSIEVKDHLFL
ncbi:MAG: beta strand repeat-containing protein [Phascolarctobacterium sp.]